MRFRIQDDVLSARLHDQPNEDAPASAGTVRGTDLLEKIADAGEPGWWRVRVVAPGAPEREGFVRSILVTEAEQEGPPQEIDKDSFFDQIAFAAQRIGANRD